MMNGERTYGNLREAFGDEIEEYTVFEHGENRGEGTAIIDPDMGGYSNDSIESFSGLAVEVAEEAHKVYQGVDQYRVEGADDLTADEAVEAIIGETTSESPPESMMLTPAQ